MRTLCMFGVHSTFHLEKWFKAPWYIFSVSIYQKLKCQMEWRDQVCKTQMAAEQSSVQVARVRTYTVSKTAIINATHI